jgi:ubiquinone/menaquinone biosynthesis C-methylase UbiE
MDPRIKDEVSEHRQEVVARECFLIKQAIETMPDSRDSGFRVVDVGCGRYGLLSRAGDRLPGLKRGSVGVDLDVAMLAQNVDVEHRVSASCYSLPFPPESVDVIICRWVFEHLESPKRALDEFSRVLRKGGVVYIKTPNLLNYGMMISWATPLTVHNAFLSKGFEMENTRTFYRANTKRKLAALAESTGLVVRDLETRPGSYLYYGFNRELFLLMRGVSRIMSKFTKSMQQTLMCVLQKP